MARRSETRSTTMHLVGGYGSFGDGAFVVTNYLQASHVPDERTPMQRAVTLEVLLILQGLVTRGDRDCKLQMTNP